MQRSRKHRLRLTLTGSASPEAKHKCPGAPIRLVLLVRCAGYAAQIWALCVKWRGDRAETPSLQARGLVQSVYSRYARYIVEAPTLLRRSSQRDRFRPAHRWPNTGQHQTGAEKRSRLRLALLWGRGWRR